MTKETQEELLEFARDMLLEAEWAANHTDSRLRNVESQLRRTEIVKLRKLVERALNKLA